MSLILQEDNYRILQEDGLYVLNEEPTSYTFIMSVGSFVLSGINANVLLNRKLVSDAGSFILNGVSSVLTVGRYLLVSVGTFAISGIAVNFVKISKIFADAVQFVFTVNPADIFKNIGIWRLGSKEDTSYSSIAKPTTSYSQISKPTTSYSAITKPTVPTYSRRLENLAFILQEDGFKIMLEDGSFLKTDENIWTNIPKA
jgi:hypothetical protein